SQAQHTLPQHDRVVGLDRQGGRGHPGAPPPRPGDQLLVMAARGKPRPRGHRASTTAPQANSRIHGIGSGWIPAIRSKEQRPMQRIVPAILLIVLLVIGGGIIANTAYQAGVSTAVTTAAANGATVVAPVVGYGYGYGYGWHPFGGGFGIFGFLFGLFFLFLIFGLIRAIF